jgi:hypothetical protein
VSYKKELPRSVNQSKTDRPSFSAINGIETLIRALHNKFKHKKGNQEKKENEFMDRQLDL